MVGEGGNSQINEEQRCLAMLLVSLPLVRFMELKDFKGVLWNRPSRCIIKQNQNVLRACNGWLKFRAVTFYLVARWSRYFAIRESESGL